MWYGKVCICRSQCRIFLRGSNLGLYAKGVGDPGGSGFRPNIKRPTSWAKWGGQTPGTPPPPQDPHLVYICIMYRINCAYACIERDRQTVSDTVSRHVSPYLANLFLASPWATSQIFQHEHKYITSGQCKPIHLHADISAFYRRDFRLICYTNIYSICPDLYPEECGKGWPTVGDVLAAVTELHWHNVSGVY